MQIINNLISCVNPCTSNSESQNICNGRLIASKRLGTAACTKSNKPDVAVIMSKQTLQKNELFAVQNQLVRWVNPLSP